MRKIRKEKNIKDIAYENYLFHNLFFIITIPLLIMAGILYFVSYQSETNKNSLILQSYNMQMQDFLEEGLTELKEYYLDVTNGEEYQWLNEQMDAPYDNIENLLKMQKVLRGGRIEGAVEGFLYINVQNEWILTNHGMYDFAQVDNLDTLEAFLIEQEKRSEDVYWLNNTEDNYENTNPYGYGHVDVSGWNMILKMRDRHGSINNMLIIHMNSMSILQRIQMYKNEGYDIVWMDSQGILFETNTQNSPIMQEYVSDVEGEVENKKGYLVTSSYDKTNGMRYIIGYNTNRDRWKVVAILVFAFVFIPFYVLFIYALYRVSKSLEQPFLSLYRTREEQEQNLKKLFINNLLTGNMSQATIDELMSKYQYSNYAGYRMLFVKIREGSVSLEQLLESFPDRVKELVFITSVVYKNCIVILVGNNDEESTEYKTALLIKELKNFVYEEYGSLIRIGISRHFSELDTSAYAAQECQEALFKARYREEGSFMMLYDDFTLADKKGTTAESVEEELYGAITECNDELAYRLLKEILDKVEQQGLWGESRVLYIYRLLLNILQIPQRESMLFTDIFSNGEIHIFKWKELVFDRVLLEKYIADDIMRPIMEELKAQQLTTGTEIVRKMKKIIRDQRGDITLAECAEALNYHPGYLSRVLKQENGMSYTQLINEEKLKLAKYTLLTTKFSIAEISAKLGYNNVQNFIRFFKNQTDMTPAQFRKEGQKNV